MSLKARYTLTAMNDQNLIEALLAAQADLVAADSKLSTIVAAFEVTGKTAEAEAFAKIGIAIDEYAKTCGQYAGNLKDDEDKRSMRAEEFA